MEKSCHEKSATRPVPKEQTVTSNKSLKLYPICFGLRKLILNPSDGYSMPKLKSMKDNQLIREYRPLKLVYGHDIRLAQMPLNSSFEFLRALVGKCFPMLKTVVIKYEDSDGDFVDVMSSPQLRIAESCADNNSNAKEPDNEEKRVSTLSMLRLHIVKVNPKQLEEEEEEEEDEEIEEVKPIDVDEKEKTEVDCKEVEMTDDWLFDFAQIFLTHVGIDPNSHIHLQKVGMELCSEALKETVTSEEAQTVLFDKAASKFEEMAALAFYNWGNVHMCAAQKITLIDEEGPEETTDEQLKNAYDLLREKYSLAGTKYKEALLIKPDFYKALFALGQQQFEMGKLNWSFALVKESDISKWDPTMTIWLFDSAAKKIRAATKMWEQMEEQRANESEQGKKDEVSKKKKNEIHLFWGNMLFQRSQIECKLGLSGWDKNLDAAVEKFKLAGIPEPVISTVLKNHCWYWKEEE